MEQRRNNSKKRQAILGALCETKEHPTAEMLYNRLKPEFPELSLGTVYRNLAVLVESGDIISLGKVDGHERYDATVTPHAHFICCNCGRVYDLNMPQELGKFYDDMGVRSGCRVDSISLSINGLCKACFK